MIEFLYNIITRDNAENYGLSEEWWNNHPDWNYYVRTNKRYHKNNRIWLGGGGKTLEDALKSAVESVECNEDMIAQLGQDNIVIFSRNKAVGTLTQEIIKN